jgi:monoamine oxidase
MNVALRSLGRCFNLSSKHVRSLLQRSFIVNWQADPFSLGAYSYAPVGQRKARSVLAAPVANTVFFAGEATNIDGYAATVHGAIASGQRVAQEIIDAMKRPRAA